MMLRIVQRGLVLTALFVCVCAGAQDKPTPSEFHSRYEGSIKGRVYTNAYFGFSYQLPKGMKSASSQFESLLKSSAVKNKDQLRQIQQQDREHGVLLLAGPSDPPKMVSMSDRRAGFSSPNEPRCLLFPARHLSVVAKPTDSMPEVRDPKELLSSYASGETPVNETRELQVDGHVFFRRDYRLNAKVCGQESERHLARIVTAIKDHFLILTFTEDSASSLDKLTQSMRQFRFTTPTP